MAFATINKGASYFNTVLYTGTGSTTSITGVGFKPDWVWIKDRTNGSANHNEFDALRIWSGDSLPARLYPNSDSAEESTTYLGASNLTAFNSNGFSLGGGGNTNTNTNSYVAWNWLGANSTATNTSGTITSTVSANTTSGFSIVSYTGTGSNATVGHGLGTAPSMIFLKIRSATDAWIVYSKALGNTKIMVLNSSAAVQTRADWNNTSPTSSVFSIGTFSNENTNGATYIAYCFAEIKGFSKFGSYTGNGSADGTFVYTGFKPAFIMIKSSSSAAGNWLIQDNKRLGYNASNSELYANLTNAESTNDRTDLLSNGFKARINSGENNSSGVTYIYAAFAENPFVLTDGTPVTAR